MKRKAATVVVVGLLACIFVEESRGGSAFARITAETEEEYDLSVQILPVDGHDDKCVIVPPKVYAAMGSYLVVCREGVLPERQDFRPYIWHSGEGREDVLLVAPLLPHGSYGPEARSHIIPTPPRPNQVILDKSFLSRSYIYIDYPTFVMDGGTYYCVDLSTYPLPEDRAMRVRYSPAKGLGPEQGVMRRDPSDIIKVGDLYYVWYTKSHVSHGYDATVWYATSTDGHTWAEKGETVPRGPESSWDAQSVFTPNILVAKGRYYLLYTGVPKPFNNKGNKVTKSAIGIAVSESPNGPWEKLPANPILKCSRSPADFDSMRVDDACLVVRDGRYWLYYKGRQWANTPANTMTGVAIAERPEGPYERYVDNPVIRGGHEVLVWPLGDGVAAMVNIGPEGIRKTVQYAPEGLSFSRMMNLDDVPRAPGAYRPEAFRDKGQGPMIEWGLHIGRQEGVLPFLERFDCHWEPSAEGYK